MKTASSASSLGFADACLCGKAGLVSLESKCSELSELSGSSGLRDHAGTPDQPQLGTAQGHCSSKHYRGPEQNDGQCCCLHR